MGQLFTKLRDVWKGFLVRAGASPVDVEPFGIVRPTLRPIEIPVVIPTFNNPTYCKKMIQQLRDRDVERIIVFDNGSTFAPMKKFLASPPSGVEIMASAENLGPWHVILNPTCLSNLPNYFCLTDPDLEFRAEMPKSFLHDLAELTDRFKIGKAGLALDLSDRAAMEQRKFDMPTGKLTIWDWEKQFWKKQVGSTSTGDPIYRSAIDTTLAVYNKTYYKPKEYWQAVRVAGRYTCKHLPWYKDKGLPHDEEAYYKSLATRSFYLADKPPVADATS